SCRPIWRSSCRMATSSRACTFPTPISSPRSFPSGRSAGAARSRADGDGAASPSPAVSPAAPALSLRRLRKTFGPVVAVDEVSLDVAPGEFLSLLGPSGCGKSTVLRMVAGLVEPDAGQVLLAGEDVTRTAVHRRNVGLVFQSYALFPHMTVFEN